MHFYVCSNWQLYSPVALSVRKLPSGYAEFQRRTGLFFANSKIAALTKIKTKTNTQFHSQSLVCNSPLP